MTDFLLTVRDSVLVLLALIGLVVGFICAFMLLPVWLAGALLVMFMVWVWLGEMDI